MHKILLIILLGLLGVGVGVLTWMGLTHRRRRRQLARLATEADLRFSADEPFDLVGRYGDFAAVSAGHSPRAENMLSGRRGRWRFRVFDYTLEVGHGPGRVLRRHSVMIAETDVDLPGMLLWHGEDLQQAPLAARYPTGRIGPWRVIDEKGGAEVLAEALAEIAHEPVSVQTQGGAVMLCCGRRLAPARMCGWIDGALSALEWARTRLPA